MNEDGNGGVRALLASFEESEREMRNGYEERRKWGGLSGVWWSGLPRKERERGDNWGGLLR